MARPHAHRIALVEQRREEGQADEMVEMGMREIDVDIERRLARELQAERADAGAGVEDQAAAAGAHLQARGIAAVAHIFCTGARDRASHAPEADFQTIGQRQNSLSSPGRRVHGRAARVNRRWRFRPRNCGRVLAYACQQADPVGPILAGLSVEFAGRLRCLLPRSEE